MSYFTLLKMWKRSTKNRKICMILQHRKSVINQKIKVWQRNPNPQELTVSTLKQHLRLVSRSNGNLAKFPKLHLYTFKLNKNNLTDENRPEESKRKQHSKTDDLANASDTGEDIIVVEKNKPKKKKKKANNKNKSPEKPIEKQLIVECEEKIENDSVKQPKGAANCTLVSEIAKARQHIKNSLERMDGIAALAAPFENGADLAERVTNLEKMFADLQKQFGRLEKQFTESKSIAKSDAIVKGKSVAAVAKVEKKQEEAKNESENDDGVDLFASDSEDDKEADAIREQRLAAYKEKKSKKPALIAKSSVVFDIKPWDDSTDMKAMEVEIRKITADGLLWGASKLQLIAYGIKKLVLSCVVEDEKVSIDWLVEEIEKLEDYVQSVDIAAFNKI